MLEHSVIGRTGQAAKAVIAAGGLILGGAISLLPLQFFGDATSTPAVLVKFGAALFSLGCFFYGCRAIRCPACGVRWVWEAVSGRAVDAWLASLLRTPNCPACGHPDRRRPPNTVPAGGASAIDSPCNTVCPATTATRRSHDLRHTLPR